jgi:signal transduction histidine kinase
LLVSVIIIGLIIFSIFRFRIARLQRARLVQQDFSRHLISAHESERRRIAAELHDGLGHSLAMIKNSAVAVTEIENVSPTAKQQLEQISEQTAQAISEVREISYNLRPYLLDYLGLTKAIKSLLNRISGATIIEIEAEIDEIDNLFGNEAEMSIYRIIQESLNNILKHANADKVSVIAKKQADLLTIIIHDDGKGFDQAAESIKIKPGGFGLLGITERVSMLGGTHSIKSSQEKGTTIKISVKLNKERKKINE